MALTNKQIRRRYYLRHTDEIKAKAREHYLKCGRRRGEMTEERRRKLTGLVRQWRGENPEKYEASLKRQRRARWEKAKLIKQEILTHYNNGKLGCVKCGEFRPACLSIDHIEGGGTKERRDNGITGSHSFYLWLKHQGFPRGYQTLCMNCQFIKRFENSEYSSRRE